MNNKNTSVSIETVFRISNMVCEGCAENITELLKALPGVKNIKPKVFQKQMLVNYYPEQIKREELISALAKNGYTAIET